MTDEGLPGEGGGAAASLSAGTDPRDLDFDLALDTEACAGGTQAQSVAARTANYGQVGTEPAPLAAVGGLPVESLQDLQCQREASEGGVKFAELARDALQSIDEIMICQGASASEAGRMEAHSALEGISLAMPPSEAASWTASAATATSASAAEDSDLWTGLGPGPGPPGAGPGSGAARLPEPGPEPPVGAQRVLGPSPLQALQEKPAQNRQHRELQPGAEPTAPASKLTSLGLGAGVGVGAGAAGSLAALRRAYGSEAPPVAGLGVVTNAAPAGPGPGQAPTVVSGSRSLSPAAAAQEGLAREEQQAAQAAEAEEGELEDEWSAVAARTEEMRRKEAAEPGRLRVKGNDLASPISKKEVQEWLETQRPDEQLLEASREQQVDGAVCGCIPHRRSLAAIPGLQRRLGADRDKVVCLRKTDFDFNDLTHFRMLRTMYTKLTRNKTCASIGHHWVDIGFQYTDPRQDLNRSGGVLNVLHMFFFMSQHFEILKAAFLLSRDELQNFPLACISINITKLVMDSLFAGRLSPICNASGPRGVFDTTCRLHAAALYHFYFRWRSQKCTIRDTERTLKEIEASLRRRPALLVKGLEKGVEDQRAKGDPARFEFTDLDFGTARAAAPAPPHRASAAVAPPPAAQAIPKRLQNYHETNPPS